MFWMKDCSHKNDIQVETIKILHETVCYQPFAQICFLAENQKKEQIFINKIEGFNYETGFSYELKIVKEATHGKEQDKPAFRYKLVEITSKTKTVENGVANVYEINFDNIDEEIIKKVGSDKYLILNELSILSNDSQISTKLEDFLNNKNAFTMKLKVSDSKIYLTEIKSLLK